MIKWINRKLTDLTQKGQGMVEYALILAFVVAIMAVTVSSRAGLGQAISSVFSNAAAQM